MAKSLFYPIKHNENPLCLFFIFINLYSIRRKLINIFDRITIQQSIISSELKNFRMFSNKNIKKKNTRFLYSQVKLDLAHVHHFYEG